MLGVSAVRQYMYESSFQTVQAKLIRVESQDGMTSENNMTLYSTAYYEYVVNGQWYISSRDMFSVSFKKVGAVYNIRYNPENPTELQNPYNWYTTIVTTGMFALASLGLGKMLLSDIIRNFTSMP